MKNILTKHKPLNGLRGIIFRYAISILLILLCVPFVFSEVDCTPETCKQLTPQDRINLWEQYDIDTKTADSVWPGNLMYHEQIKDIQRNYGNDVNNWLEDNPRPVSSSATRYSLRNNGPQPYITEDANYAMRDASRPGLEKVVTSVFGVGKAIAGTQMDYGYNQEFTPSTLDVVLDAGSAVLLFGGVVVSGGFGAMKAVDESVAVVNLYDDAARGALKVTYQEAYDAARAAGNLDEAAHYGAELKKLADANRAFKHLDNFGLIDDAAGAVKVSSGQGKIVSGAMRKLQDVEKTLLTQEEIDALLVYKNTLKGTVLSGVAAAQPFLPAASRAKKIVDNLEDVAEVTLKTAEVGFGDDSEMADVELDALQARLDWLENKIADQGMAAMGRIADREKEIEKFGSTSYEHQYSRDENFADHVTLYSATGELDDYLHQKRMNVKNNLKDKSFLDLPIEQQRKQAALEIGVIKGDLSRYELSDLNSQITEFVVNGKEVPVSLQKAYHDKMRSVDPDYTMSDVAREVGRWEVEHFGEVETYRQQKSSGTIQRQNALDEAHTTYDDGGIYDFEDDSFDAPTSTAFVPEQSHSGADQRGYGYKGDYGSDQEMSFEGGYDDFDIGPQNTEFNAEVAYTATTGEDDWLANAKEMRAFYGTDSDIVSDAPGLKGTVFDDNFGATPEPAKSPVCCEGSSDAHISAYYLPKAKAGDIDYNPDGYEYAVSYGEGESRVTFYVDKKGRVTDGKGTYFSKKSDVAKIKRAAESGEQTSMAVAQNPQAADDAIVAQIDDYINSDTPAPEVETEVASKEVKKFSVEEASGIVDQKTCTVA